MASRSRTMLARTVPNTAALRQASSSVIIPAITSSSTSRTLSSSATQRQQAQEEGSLDPLSRPRRDPKRASKKKAKNTAPLARPSVRDPRMYIPPTQWHSPLWQFPAPPTETSRLVPQLQDRTPAIVRSNHPPTKPIMGPGGSNWTNIKYAVRGMQMRLTKQGRVIGPDGYFRGVYYKRLPLVDDVSARSQHFQRANPQNADQPKLSEQNFLERAGGDYSYLQPRRRQNMDPSDWKSNVDHAFAANADIPRSTREAFKEKVADILQGNPPVAKFIVQEVADKQKKGGKQQK